MTMLCAISGDVPTNPVASTKSGNVFEKRLIEAYIAEHGKDPVTGEDLGVPDLIELQSSRTVKPRPPTMTSIPAMLAAFQNEWDAMALATHQLRQQLVQTRQELSMALYQHDAATRVIARLIKERDESRDALSKISVSAGGSSATNGDSMDVDMAAGVPDYVKDIIDATKAQLTPTRKRRVIPDGWVTPEGFESFVSVSISKKVQAGATALAVDSTGELALVGGPKGASIFSIPKQKVTISLSADDGAIRDVAWASKRAITASSSGCVRIWNESGDDSKALSAHAGEATSITLHPSGRILASTGVDKSWVLYDIEAAKSVTQVYDESTFTTSEFHPDGHLFAAGTTSELKIYDVRSTDCSATFGPFAGPIKSLNFSENGYYLALSVENQTTVEIWDLRNLTHAKTLDIGNRVDNVKWDYSGKFLAASGPSGVSVQYFAKAQKSWSEVARNATATFSSAWGTSAKSLISVGAEGKITVFEAQG